MRHPDDALLMSYAAGSLSEAVSLLVATHVSLCQTCRDTLNELEQVGGLLLEDLPPTPLPEDPLTAMLARLDEPPPSSSPPPPALSPAFQDIPLPDPLRGYIARSGVTSWTTVIPGVVRKITLPISWDGQPVRLMRVRGGYSVPMHTHHGVELNLVLSGGFHDRGQPFTPGDIAENGEDDVHELNIDPGEDCVILAVNESPLVPVGLRAKLTSWLIGGF